MNATPEATDVWDYALQEGVTYSEALALHDLSAPAEDIHVDDLGGQYGSEVWAYAHRKGITVSEANARLKAAEAGAVRHGDRSVDWAVIATVILILLVIPFAGASCLALAIR